MVFVLPQDAGELCDAACAGQKTEMLAGSVVRQVATSLDIDEEGYVPVRWEAPTDG